MMFSSLRDTTISMHHHHNNMPKKRSINRIFEETKNFVDAPCYDYDHKRRMTAFNEQLRRDPSLKASIKRKSRHILDTMRVMPPLVDEDRMTIHYGFKYHVKELIKHPRAEFKLLSDKLKRKVFACVGAPMPCKGRRKSRTHESLSRFSTSFYPPTSPLSKEMGGSIRQEPLFYEKQMFQTFEDSKEQSPPVQVPPQPCNTPGKLSPSLLIAAAFGGVLDSMKKIIKTHPDEPDSIKELETFIKKEGNRLPSNPRLLKAEWCRLPPRINLGNPGNKVFASIERQVSILELFKMMSHGSNGPVLLVLPTDNLMQLERELDELCNMHKKQFLHIMKNYCNYRLKMQSYTLELKQLLWDHVKLRERMIDGYNASVAFRRSYKAQDILMKQRNRITSLSHRMYSVHNIMASRRMSLTGDLRVLDQVFLRISKGYMKLYQFQNYFLDAGLPPAEVEPYKFKMYREAFSDHNWYCEELLQQFLRLRNYLQKEMEDLYAAMIRF